MQIGFLSPFPNQWFKKGSTASTTKMRLISAIEMTAYYLILPFILISIFILRRKIELWIIVIFSTSMMVLFGISTPNIGTLYRMRYVYLMLLVSLALTTLFDYLYKHYFKYKQD